MINRQIFVRFSVCVYVPKMSKGRTRWGKYVLTSPPGESRCSRSADSSKIGVFPVNCPAGSDALEETMAHESNKRFPAEEILSHTNE